MSSEVLEVERIVLEEELGSEMRKVRKLSFEELVNL